MLRVSLQCHPAGAGALVTRILVAVERTEPETLALRYELEGDFSQLRVPGRAAPARRDGLWRHTCFELFLRSEGERYWEWNFSPSGEWAAYAFSGYRAGMTPLALAIPPDIRARLMPARLQLDVVTTLPESLAQAGQAPVRGALAAVVEDRSGERSYWALAHSANAPDFHAEEAFALLLPAATMPMSLKPSAEKS